jgi:hypothetical protein
MRVIITGSKKSTIDLVSTKRGAMTLRSLIVAAYAIRKDGLFNLKITGQLLNPASAKRYRPAHEKSPGERRLSGA